ncbi:MAG TPA: methyltransferase [Chitinophagaceae bacterium]
MANSWFQFKQFLVQQDRCAMKVTTDACLFGAWVASDISKNFSVDEKNKYADRRLLDIGTGTGLLSLMIAQKVSMRIDAIELDDDAFSQANENFRASPWPQQLKVLRADARQFAAPHLYDIIVSNPPFYEQELKSPESKKNIAHHSEELSLEEVVQCIKNNLQPDGNFYLLLPYKRASHVRALFEQHQFTVEKFVLVRQSATHDYFRIMIKGNNTHAALVETQIEEIAIKDTDEEYSPEFFDLLKGYYLYL